MEHVAPMTYGAHLEQSVPRYTTYPTPASFSPAVGGRHYDAWLGALPRGSALAVTLHVPFCGRLCWYCMCRTQTARSVGLVDRYLDALVAELGRTAALLPEGAVVRRMSWHGGSPSTLAPAQIARLAGAAAARLPLADGLDFAVEIDPVATDAARYDALAAAGVTRAILGVQDFAPEVQRAIGRVQDLAATAEAVAALAARGIAEVVVDQVYGLPHQTAEGVAATARAVAGLAPARVGLSGYAHVPAIAKRQRMIPDETLPDVTSRLAQFEAAAAVYAEAGYRRLGADQFAQPGDPLLAAAEAGKMRRGFEGYRVCDTDALIGFGAGAVSRLPHGMVQNVAATEGYCAALAAGGAGAERGIALGLEDRVRARAIDMLMCRFRLDLPALRDEFGDFAALLEEGCAQAVTRYGRFVAWEGRVLRIVRDAPVMARLVARLFDARTPPVGQYGLAV